MLELDLVRVKGRDTPLRIFTVVGDAAGCRGRPRFQRLQGRACRDARRLSPAGLARGPRGAAFCRPLAPSLAALYDVYEQRIAEFEMSPPPPDWDGVFTATTKQG